MSNLPDNSATSSSDDARLRSDAEPHAESDATASSASSASKRPRRRRLWLRLAWMLVVLLVVLVALAPMLLSTGTGNDLVFGIASRTANLQFENASLSVSWFGAQRFEAERVWHKGGAFDAHRVSLNAEDLSAWRLIRGGNAGGIPLTLDSLVLRPDMFPPSDEPEQQEPLGASIPTHYEALITLSANEIRWECPDQPPLTARNIESSMDLDSRADITFAIDAIVQRGGEAAGSVYADVTVRDAFDAEGRFRAGTARVEGTVEVADLSLVGIEDALGLGRVITPLVGEELHVARVTAQGTPDKLEATLHLATSRIEETVFVLQREKDVLTIRGEEPLRAEVLPASLAALLRVEPPPITDATTLTFDLTEVRIPFDADEQPRIDSIAIDASGSLAPTGIRFDGDRVVSLNDLGFTVRSKALGESIDAELTGIAAIGESTEPFSLTLDLQNVLTPQPTGTGFARLPVVLAEAAIGGDWPLVGTLGSQVETTLALTPGERRRVAYTLDVVSGRGAGQLAGWADLTGEAPELHAHTPESIRWSVTPETAEQWYRVMSEPRTAGSSAPDEKAQTTADAADADAGGTGEPAEAAKLFLTLAEPAMIELRVPHVNARFARTPRGFAVDPAASSFHVEATAPVLQLRDPEVEGRRIRAEQARIEARADQPAQGIEFIVSATIPERVADAKLYQDAGEEVAPGRINATLSIRDAMGSEGELRLEQSAIAVDATVDRVPSAVIDDLAKAESKLLALLGPVTSASIKGTYRFDEVSRFEAAMQTTNMTQSIPFALQPDRSITAPRDITVELRPTPMTFREVLGKAMPMVADAIGSTRPVIIRIDGDSLRIPLRDGLDLPQARIEGEFDLGTVRLRRDGWVGQAVFGVINDVTSKVGIKLPQRASRNVVDATFTPARFSLADGIASTEQFWLYGDDIAVGFQGSRIDVESEKIEQLSMGILGASFIAGSGGKLGPFIKADQIYTLPVSGTISNPKIEKGWLTIELTGSIISRTLDKPTFGIGGKIFDFVGDPVRDLKTKPMQLDWDKPEPVVAFLQRVKGEAPDEVPEELKEEITEQLGEQQPDEADSPADEQSDARDAVRDVLGDVLGGVFRDAIEQREREQDEQQED